MSPCLRVLDGRCPFIIHRRFTTVVHDRLLPTNALREMSVVGKCTREDTLLILTMSPGIIYVKNRLMFMIYHRRAFTHHCAFVRGVVRIMNAVTGSSKEWSGGPTRAACS